MMAQRVDQARFNMVNQQIRPWEVIDPRVLAIMERLPREAFVPTAYAALAYADTEIPIGHGESMMFPRIEARMMQALDLNPGDSVLEVGTGSGYLTACLAQLCRRVVSIDLNKEFIASADEKLQRQGIKNVLLQSGDALAALSNEGPFDVIAVTGSVPNSAQAEIFRLQLKIGGRLFIVIGTPPVMQAMLITRHRDKVFEEESLFETELTHLVNASPPPIFEF